MAIVGSCNVSTAANGGAAVIWNAINLLVNVAGTWTIDGSDDASGGPVNSEASLNNLNAWIVIRDPIVGREILFVRGANDYTFTIRYDRAGAFAGGGTGTPPTSASAQLLYNSAIFPATPGTYVAHAVCDTVAQTALFDVFPFWFGAGVLGAPAWSGGMCFLPCDVGSDPSDADPVVMLASNSTNFTGVSNWWKWNRYGLSGALWANYSRSATFGSTTPDIYGRGYIGFTSVWVQGSTQLAFSNWALQTQANFGYPDTRDLVSGPAYIFAQAGFQGFMLPWPVGVTPLV